MALNNAHITRAPRGMMLRGVRIEIARRARPKAIHARMVIGVPFFVSAHVEEEDLIELGTST